MNREQRRAAMAASNAKARGPAPDHMTMLQNGSLNQAVNFAVEDFYKAQIVLRRATQDYTVKFTDLPKGMQSFVQQQFFRLNGAGLMLDALGFQSVTEVLAITFNAASDYMQETMAEWNKTIEAEGDVERMFTEIEAEERNRGIGKMQ